MPRFKVSGRTYDMVQLDEISGRNMLTFARDASEAMGRPIRFFDVERIVEEIDAMPEDEAETHPDLELLTVVLIWVSRLAAGDKLTFGECLDEPFSFVEGDDETGPKDRLPPKKKASSRKSSGAAKRASAGAASSA